jgi:hypothetical protein
MSGYPGQRSGYSAKEPLPPKTPKPTESGVPPLPSKLTCSPYENPNIKAAEWIGRHLAALTAAVEKLTAVIEKQEER